MKIRIKGNSIRYRLTQTDLKYFEKAEMLTEHIDFGDQKLIYAIEKSHTEQNLKVNFEHNTITLYVPEKIAAEWFSTSRTGFSAQDGHVHILLEKDFQCLDNVEEDQSDNFPNPLAGKHA